MRDFDGGIESLQRYVEAVKSPIVVANLDLTYVPKLTNRIRKSKILDVCGKKLGVVGYITKNIMSHPRRGQIIVTDEFSAVVAESKRLAEKGVNMIIALGNAGFDVDTLIARDIEEVDLVIGGSNQKFVFDINTYQLDNATADWYPEIVNHFFTGKKTPIIRTPGSTKYLGYLKVDFDSKGNLVHWRGKPLFLSNKLPKNKEAVALLNTYRTAVDKLGNRSIGYTTVYLEKEECEAGECNFGNLIADAFREYAIRNRKTKSGNPIAFVNSGTISHSIDPSNIKSKVSYVDLLEAVPHRNYIYLTFLRGLTILKSLEYSASCYQTEDKRGRFLQFSGLHVIYNTTMPIGLRVVSAKALCQKCLTPKFEPIIPHETYTIVASDYILSGANGYHYMMKFKSHSEYLGVNIDIIADYMNNKRFVFPGIEGRIKIQAEKNTIDSSAHKTFSSVRLIYIFICTYIRGNI